MAETPQIAGGVGSKEDGASWKFDVRWPTSPDSTVYDLSHSMHPGMTHHPNHPPFAFSLTKAHGDIMYPEGVSASAEMISLGGHVGTHIDALSHVSRDGMVCGSLSIVDNQSYTDGMGEQSIDGMAPVIANAHLLDLPTLLGREVTEEDGVGADEFERWFADHPAPEAGSVVLVRFGWDRYWSDIGKYLGIADGVPGVTLSGAEWLSERSILATGADTIAYEKYPPYGQLATDVHVHLLVEKGIPIMEALHLAELSAAECWEFLFIAVPMKIRGGTGSPIRPLAVVGG